MEQELIKIFKETEYKPDLDLGGDIWRAIITHDRNVSRFKLWAFGFAGFASFVGLIPAFKILYNDLGQSGFFEYLSLGFSSSVFSYWKEIGLSILESLPVMSILLSLTVVFVFFLSLRYMIKQINNSRLSLAF